MNKKSTRTKESKIIKNKIYISFNFRIILYGILFVILLTSTILILLNSLDFIEQKSINYTEKSNLDYKVYLKENEFYETSYLDKDMIYISSLIDNININFDYNFVSDENINLDFKYKILAKLSIMDVNEENTYFEKEYILLDDKTNYINNGTTNNIKEVISIDYDYYNNLANKFRVTYGLDTVSKLIVYLVIDKSNVDNDSIITNDVSQMLLIVPLSEKSVNIKLDYNEINKTSNLISKSNVIIDNIIFIVVAIILLILSMVTLIKFIRLLTLLKNNKGSFDKYVNRLLNEYDRLIVETSTCPVISGDNVIKIDKFQELLDVRDNLKLPIMYYVVTKHQKCYFYIVYGNKTYLTVVKAIDLINNKI